MKSMTQRQLEAFQTRVTAIARSLEGQAMFPEGDQQVGTIILGERRGVEVSHDLFKGHIVVKGLWPKDKFGQNIEPPDRKVFRLGYVQPDDFIAEKLKETFLVWYEVAIEQIEELIATKKENEATRLRCLETCHKALEVDGKFKKVTSVRRDLGRGNVETWVDGGNETTGPEMTATLKFPAEDMPRILEAVRKAAVK